LTIDYNASSEAILAEIMDAIEQSERFNPKFGNNSSQNQLLN